MTNHNRIRRKAYLKRKAMKARKICKAMLILWDATFGLNMNHTKGEGGVE